MRLTFPNVAAIPPGVWVWPHVNPASEWACHGDGSLVVETDFLDRFERLRAAYGAPMSISSGYRSPAYNLAVAHTGDSGPHTTGRACDVLVPSSGAGFRLLTLALQCGFTGIGVQLKTPAFYLHLDDLPSSWGPRPGLWSY